jgi:hypothetical protein
MPFQKPSLHNHRDEFPLPQQTDISLPLQNVCIKFCASGPLTKLIKFGPNGGIFQELRTQTRFPYVFIHPNIQNYPTVRLWHIELIRKAIKSKSFTKLLQEAVSYKINIKTETLCFI